MIRNAILIASSAVLLSGCVHRGLMPTRTHRDYSSSAFEYALLANNAYADDEWVELPSDITLEVECGNDELGLAYSIFRRDLAGPRDEYVFAFRGTERGAEGKKDWRYGNFGTWQQRKSDPILKAFANAYRGQEIVLVGHSLGGALAVHNSMRIDDSRVYIFNSSPRFFAPPGYDPRKDPSVRLSIAESGEILKAARLLFKEAWQTYVPFNCFGKGSPIAQHSILKLGICLTRIAAAEPVPAGALRARQIIDRNAWAVDATTHPLIASANPAPKPVPRSPQSHVCHTPVFSRT